MSLNFNICVILILCVAHFKFLTTSLRVTSTQHKGRNSTASHSSDQKFTMNDQNVKLMQKSAEKSTFSQCSSYVYRQHTPLNKFSPINQDVLIESFCNILKFITCEEGNILSGKQDGDFISPRKLGNSSWNNDVIRDTNNILQHIEDMIKELLKFEAMISYPDNSTLFYVFNPKKIYERWKVHSEDILVHSDKYIVKSLELHFKEFYVCSDLDIDIKSNELFSVFDKVENKTVKQKLCEGSGKYFSDMQIVIELLKYLSLESKKLISNIHKLNTSDKNFAILSEDIVKNMSYIFLANVLHDRMKYRTSKYDIVLDAIETLIQNNKHLLEAQKSTQLSSELSHITKGVFNNCHCNCTTAKNSDFDFDKVKPKDFTFFKTNSSEQEDSKLTDRELLLYKNTTYDESISNLFTDLLLENETISYDDIDALIDLIHSNNSEINSLSFGAPDEEEINTKTNDAFLINSISGNSDISAFNVSLGEDNSTNGELNVYDEELVTADVQYVNDDVALNNTTNYSDEVENFVNTSKLLQTRDNHESVNCTNNANTLSSKHVNTADNILKQWNGSGEDVSLKVTDEPHEELLLEKFPNSSNTEINKGSPRHKVSLTEVSSMTSPSLDTRVAQLVHESKLQKQNEKSNDTVFHPEGLSNAPAQLDNTVAPLVQEINLQEHNENNNDRVSHSKEFPLVPPKMERESNLQKYNEKKNNTVSHPERLPFAPNYLNNQVAQLVPENNSNIQSDTTVAHLVQASNPQEHNEKSRDTVLRMVDATYQIEAQEKNSSNRTWPVKQAAEIPGDVLLGALMMVHARSESVTCGPVMAQGGIQALETMLYTLDVINARRDKKITIGAHILDDCDTDTYGLEMALDFIKGSISNIDDTDYHCNKTQVRKVISGVVGAASSVTSIQVANLLRLFKIPQVSFFSTSPELSNKQRFEYFTRTIPSDHYQVKAMVEIVKKLRWSYVSIIYEESNYGIKAFEELEVLLAKSDICIAVKEKLVKDSGVAEERAYDDIVLKLMTKPRARGVIVFGSDQEVAGVMRAVRRLNATGSFSWVGSDGWSARGLVSDGSEPEVEGTLSLQPQANPVKGFDEYFLNLTVENNRRNPWFVEFWEDHFRCKYPNSSRTPYNAHYSRECTTREKLTRDSLAFEKQLQFVSDAVMAFSNALDHMHAELCGGQAGLCEAMRPTRGSELLKYLRRVSFKGLSEDHFKFDKDGDGPARYNIIHFKQTMPGQYQWVQVGEYLEGELHLNMSAIQFKLHHPSPPESVCSLPCDTGQAKKYVEGEICCWHCFNCSQYQIRMPSDETQCLTCPEGTKPNPQRQDCLEIPAMFIEITSTWAIGAMALSSTGILMTLLIVGVFIRHNNTPVVKAAGRELSYVLLFGILLCYLVTFVLVLQPSDLVCALQRFGAGFCFTVVYAALLTKTNRISRIFNAGKRTAKRPNFITPKSQLIICGGLVSVQVLINGVWMLVSPPRAIHHYPSREDNILVCSSFINASYMIAFGYPILLIVVCTVYAILTRNIPEAFNESKHIGFTMYTTCVIWLAFVPLYFGTGNHMPLRITTMSVTISLSASVTVACLFSPKLYIILLRPDRNVRTNMMMTYRYSGGTAKTTTSVSMMAAAMAVTGTNAQISQQLNNAVTQKCLELEMNSLKRHHSKSPLLITRSTQTLPQDVQATTLAPSPCLSLAPSPCLSLAPSLHSPLRTPSSSIVPAHFSVIPPSPSHYLSPTDLPHTSLEIPSFLISAANGGTKLSNENHASL